MQGIMNNVWISCDLDDASEPRVYEAAIERWQRIKGISFFKPLSSEENNIANNPLTIGSNKFVERNQERYQSKSHVQTTEKLLKFECFFMLSCFPDSAKKVL